jgi:glycosyltransferase involved in cell wall biosynthesis
MNPSAEMPHHAAAKTVRRILFVTSFPYGNITTGQGLILTRICDHLNSTPTVAADWATFRQLHPDIEGVRGSHSSATAVFNIPAPRLSRFEMAFGVLRPTMNEALAQALHAAASMYDVFVWMGLPTDPVTTLLPRVASKPWLYYIVDSPTLHAKRRANGIGGRIRLMLVRTIERRVLRCGYRAVIYVTHEDVASAAKLGAGAGTAVNLLPIGVDTKEWHPSDRGRLCSGPVKIVFSGVMNFRPNIDAAVHLVRNILPRVMSDCEVFIVGKDPVPEVLELGRLDRRVRVTGAVDSVRRYLQDCDIFVAPMVRSAGIKIKIVQAMAMGLPVVATGECAAAFSDAPGGMVIADSADDFSAAIDRLAGDHAARSALGQEARRYVELGWSWEERGRGFAEIVAQAVT